MCIRGLTMKVHVDDCVKTKKWYEVYLNGEKVKAVYADDENGIILVLDEETLELIEESVSNGTEDVVDHDLHEKLWRVYYKALRGNVVIKEVKVD